MKSRIIRLKKFIAIGLLAAVLYMTACNNSKDNTSSGTERTDTIINPPVNTNNADTPIKPVDTLPHPDTTPN
jgi:hypothetical protein